MHCSSAYNSVDLVSYLFVEHAALILGDIIALSYTSYCIFDLYI